METKDIFSEQVTIVQELLLRKIKETDQRGSITNIESRYINEALVAIDKVLRCDFLQPHDRILLEKTYRCGSDIVHERLNFFSNYYYSYAEIARGDLNSQQTAFIKINADTATMLTIILGFNRQICDIGSSTDDNFVERMPRVLWAIQYVYKKSLEEVYTPSIYVLVNLEQALTEYIFSSHQTYKEKAKKLLSDVESLLSLFEQNAKIKENIKSNLQLNLFLTVQKLRTNSVFGNKKNNEQLSIGDISHVRTEGKLRILSSLFYLDKKQFIQYFEAELASLTDDTYRSRPGLNNFLFLQCLSHYCSLDELFNNTIELNLKSFGINKIDVQYNLKNIFSKYEESHKENISRDELNILLGYSDEILRAKLADTIIGVDKGVLEREKKKPHGAFEIADMELKVRLNQESYFLCMPFKSGVEIKSSTVPESVSYQIFRPFIHFDKTIVVFITAKRCSQNLMNYIKRMEDKLGWGIAVLENEELAKLLKINGQLN